jgi:hypothetical protein
VQLRRKLADHDLTDRARHAGSPRRRPVRVGSQRGKKRAGRAERSAPGSGRRA